MKEIKLTGKTGNGKYALVDDEDYEWLSNFKWYGRIDKNGNVYSFTSMKNKEGRFSTVQMHRLIMNAPAGKLVDHKNHNSLDNRKENLRICSNKENQRNTSSHKNTSSIYKGVTYREKHGYYEAYVDRISFGLFTNEIAAANCHNYYAKIHHGEFANLNNVEYMNKEEWEKFKIIKKKNKYHGVSLTENNRWRVRVNVNGKEIALGRFDNEEEAALVYNNYVIKNKLNKKLNKIPEVENANQNQIL